MMLRNYALIFVGDTTLRPQKTGSAIWIMHSEASVTEDTNFKSWISLLINIICMYYVLTFCW